MIVGINYDTDGNRYIARIDYVAKRQRIQINKVAGCMKYEYDEVYIIECDNTNQPFIDEIVLHGCRM